ncbi:MAG: metallophosphoesterase [Planctomyces sp.]|nr:metallophosphoesterase [Planctomyces sp.]
MARAAFVSDLHLFARRSHAERHLPQVRKAATEVDHFILGGDIFDFRWAQGCPRAAIDSAVSWLRDMAVQAPQSRIHFLLGNHDDHRDLVARLPGLCEELPNFNWHRFYLRLGSSVFLHGDAADGRLTAERLLRRRETFRHCAAASWKHDAYHWVLKTRLDQIVCRAVHPQRLVVRRLLAYLRDIQQGPEQGVESVYFGHTHRQIDGLRHGGVVFHNGGAPIGAARFRILRAEVEE